MCTFSVDNLEQFELSITGISVKVTFEWRLEGGKKADHR